MVTYGTAGYRAEPHLLIDIIRKCTIYCAYLSSANHVYGIMLTASHNHENDNGVKIIEPSGEMLSDHKELEAFVNGDIIIKVERESTIAVGYDTRKSAYTLLDIMMETADEISCKIINYGLVTTPQMHFLVANPSLKLEDYYKNFNFKIKNKTLVDCANGIGAIAIKRFTNNKKIIIMNKGPKHLNHECGADYVKTNGRPPKYYDFYDEDSDVVTFASFDGDADRLIYYTYPDFKLIDGDYQAALCARYFSSYPNVGCVVTAYTNGAAINYIKSLGVPVFIEKTGVRHLHKKAKEFDIGIYFEANGHGTVLFKIDHPLAKIFSQYTGDAIANLFAFDMMLQEMKMGDVCNLFKKDESVLIKVNVDNKDIIKTSYDETMIIEPIEMQNIIDEHKGKCRAFARPSGTENVVRLYVEGGDCDSVAEAIKSKIESIYLTSS